MKADLHINTFLRNGITCLGDAYVNSPFKLMNITEDKTLNQLHLMVMSSSPGVLDNDAYDFKIKVVDDGALQLHTQSYQRLFNMKNGATQNMEVTVGKGSSFIFLPHPSVPHEQSIFKAKNTFYLQHDSNLIWGEILTCGRKLNGEVFQFSSYHSTTDIYRNGQLIIKENLFMQPAIVDPSLLGQMEGYTHQASMIIINNKSAIDANKETIYNYLTLLENVSFGVSVTPGNGLIVRVLGYKAEQLHDSLKHISTLI
jgi:urease accessory protein